MNEIYDTIQGESTLAGMPCTLVRLAGCPLRCNYCDTPQALDFDSGDWHPIDAIVQDVRRRDRPLVLVSGGEPLAQRHCVALLERLAASGRLVQLETSGAYDIEPVPEGVRRILDIKTPGSGESARNRMNNLQALRPGDEIKFVLTSRSDYEWARSFIRAHALGDKPAVLLLSPAWGMLEPAALSAWLLEDRLPARLQLQWHKIIWGGDAVGV
ncbi:MAG: radical SAM protein [Mariprofundaceae bacterium]